MATERDAADMTGPYGGEFGTVAPGTTVKRTGISAVAFTASSVAYDMSDSNHFGGDHYTSRFVRLICDQIVTYFWSNNSGAVVDDTAKDGTTRDRQGDQLPANTPREEVATGRYLVMKGAAVGTMRVSIVQTFKPGQ